MSSQIRLPIYIYKPRTSINLSNAPDVQREGETQVDAQQSSRADAAQEDVSSRRRGNAQKDKL